MHNFTTEFITESKQHGDRKLFCDFIFYFLSSSKNRWLQYDHQQYKLFSHVSAYITMESKAPWVALG